VTTRLPGIRAISIATGAALLLGLALTTAPAAHAAGSPRALVVKQGMGTKGKRSVRVRAVQHALQRHGLRVHRADGRFGRATRAAVRRFQRRAGLQVDGVVGTRTRQALGLTARFTRVHYRRVRARRAAAHRRAVARHRAAVLADHRRALATPAPRRAAPDPAPVVAPAVHATATPPAKPGAVASARHGLPGGPDLTAALATLIVIATWLLVRQAPPREGRPALALGGGGMVPAGVPASGTERTGRVAVAELRRVAGSERGSGEHAPPASDGAASGADPRVADDEPESREHAPAANDEPESRQHAPAASEEPESREHAPAASEEPESRQHAPAASDEPESGEPESGEHAPAASDEPRTEAPNEPLGRARFAGVGASHRRREGAAPPRPLGAGAPVIAYVDTSGGVGARAAKKIERTCARAGWDLIEVVAERGDRRAAERAGLAYALARIENGEANALVIRDIADLGRRGVGRAALTRRVRNAGAALVTCVPGGTPVIDQRTERPGRAGRDGAPRRGAHDLRRRTPGTTPGVPPRHRERGAS
jgi:hypothetical protein